MNVKPPKCGGACPLFVFAGGGTGGHLYPAIAIAEAVRRQQPDSRFAFLGTQRPIDRRVMSAVNADFIPQDLPVVTWNPLTLVRGLRPLRTTRRAVRRFFESERPAAVLGTGGMASVPAVLEAAKLGIPVALFNPDAVPGKANRFLARRSQIVFVQFEDSVAQFHVGTKVSVTGCPVRSAFGIATREAGIARFGLDTTRKTLLVTGASQGARTVNQAVVANADILCSKRDWQILHLTGEADYEMVTSSYGKHAAGVRILAYTEDMAEAMGAADLIVSRAGASTLAEIIAVGRASILMPYPFHRDQHQLANAECLVRPGATRVVRDAIREEVNAPRLREALDELMESDDVRARMAEAARMAGGGRRPAETIATQFVTLGGVSPVCGKLERAPQSHAEPQKRAAEFAAADGPSVGHETVKAALSRTR